MGGGVSHPAVKERAGDAAAFSETSEENYVGSSYSVRAFQNQPINIPGFQNPTSFSLVLAPEALLFADESTQVLPPSLYILCLSLNLRQLTKRMDTVCSPEIFIL